MKKVISLVVMFTMVMMMVPATYALTYNDEAAWAVSTQQHITGVLAPDQIEDYMGMQDPPKPFIRGFLDNGLVREKGVQYFDTDSRGNLYGFTKMRTSVYVSPDYADLVNEIVYAVCGIPEGEKLTAADYIAATYYFADDYYVGHRFFKANVKTWKVGRVTVNEGRDTFDLYMGDWDGDGAPDLGFAAGWTQCQPRTCCPFRTGCYRVVMYVCARVEFYATMRQFCCRGK